MMDNIFFISPSYPYSGRTCRYGLALVVNYKKWKQLSIWMMLGILILLILVLIPEIGHEVKGGRRWLRYGSLSVQPAELLKVVLIIYVASYTWRENRNWLLSSEDLHQTL